MFCAHGFSLLFFVALSTSDCMFMLRRERVFRLIYACLCFLFMCIYVCVFMPCIRFMLYDVFLLMLCKHLRCYVHVLYIHTLMLGDWAGLLHTHIAAMSMHMFMICMYACLYCDCVHMFMLQIYICMFMLHVSLSLL